MAFSSQVLIFGNRFDAGVKVIAPRLEVLRLGKGVARFEDMVFQNRGRESLVMAATPRLESSGTETEFPKESTKAIPFPNVSGNMGDYENFMCGLKKAVMEGYNQVSICDDSIVASKPIYGIIRFDGAISRKSGLAGAGAGLYDHTGKTLSRHREGLGRNTAKAAEFKGLILGLKQAKRKGFEGIRIEGNSVWVYSQILGLWNTNKDTISELRNEAVNLIASFKYHKIILIHKDANMIANRDAHEAVFEREGKLLHFEGGDDVKFEPLLNFEGGDCEFEVGS